jgi:hypothetical protein
LVLVVGYLVFLNISFSSNEGEIKKASSENPVGKIFRRGFLRFLNRCLIISSFPELFYKNQLGQDLAPDTPEINHRNRLLRFRRACPSTFLDKSSIILKEQNRRYG